MNTKKKYSQSLIVLVLILLTSLVVVKMAGFDSFLLDDPVHLERNERMGTLSWDNLKFFWANPYENAYMPVSYTVWLVQSAFAHNKNPNAKDRFNAQIFHMTNVLLHLSCVVLLFFVLFQMTNNQIASFLGALFFALHPVQIEPIGWITGMRGLLVGNLSMLSILCYFKYTFQKETKFKALFYVLAFSFFLLATLAKPSAYALIPILFIVCYFIKGHSFKSTVYRLLPWLILSALLLPKHLGLNGAVVARAVPNYEYWMRPLVMMDAFYFYIAKILFPFPLTIDYSRTPEYVIDNQLAFKTAWFPIVGAFLLFYFRNKKYVREITIAIAIVLLGILPVSGLTPFIFQHISTVSDRYLYLSMFGPAWLVAFAYIQFEKEKVFELKKVHLGFAAVLLCYAFIGFNQASTWKNSLTLFAHNVKVTPFSWLANNNLAHAYEHNGQFEKSYHFYKQAAIYAKFPAIWNNVGALAVKLRRYDEALEAFQKVLEQMPESAEAFNNIGVVWANKGNSKIASRYFDRAFQINPNLAKNTKQSLKKLKPPHG